MDINLSSFVSLTVNPDETVKVTVPENSLWAISSVSLVIKDDIPTEGRIVVYAATVKEDGKLGEKIAIAPIKIGSNEVVNVDYEINCVSPIVFSTSGTKVAVSINGHTTTPAPLQIEKL